MRIPYGYSDQTDQEKNDLLRHEKRSQRGERLTVRNSEWRVGETLEGVSEDMHNKRSERAQSVDEQQNAPLPDTWGEWAENPDRYDLPGVDTIPEDVEKERAESFAESQKERGAVNQIRTVETGNVMDRPNKFADGAFDRYEDEIRLSEGRSDPAFTLAHEAGHAADAFATEGADTTKRAYELDEMFESEDRKETVGQQLTQLSERARGEYSDTGDESLYRDSPNEKIADAVGLAVIEPGAAKREAPEAVSFLEEQGILEF